LESYIKTGDLYDSEAAGGNVFIVIAEDPPSDREHTSCNCQLQLVEAKYGNPARESRACFSEKATKGTENFVSRAIFGSPRILRPSLKQQSPLSVVPEVAS